MGLATPGGVVGSPTGVTQISGLSHQFGGAPLLMFKRPLIFASFRFEGMSDGELVLECEFHGV
jgi:hypothetical protein